MNHYEILELYMALGGVPYYWVLLRKERALLRILILFSSRRLLL